MNINIPTSGAEIGGAFGGEKATGGGRESGMFSRDNPRRLFDFFSVNPLPLLTSVSCHRIFIYFFLKFVDLITPGLKSLSSVNVF